MKILLIDDSWEFTEPVKYLLERDGYIVDVIDESDNANDVIEKKIFGEYELIILDVMFTVGETFKLGDNPEVGIFLYRKIREYNKKIPIIIVSSLNRKLFEKYFEGDNLVKYVEKPLTKKIEELKTAIRNLTR
jgi:DNA-binding response OmpR family regulator